MFAVNKTKVSVETEFNLPVKGKTTTGLEFDFHPAVPKKDNNYVFQPSLIRPLLSFMEFPGDDAFWVWGLYGTGKTSIVKQTCARLFWPCYSINGSETLEMEDLLYRTAILPDGTTKIELNALSRAFVEGAVFLFNEIDLCDPSRLAALNEILAGDTLVLPGIDEVLTKHENFRFIATANTNGSFDDDKGIDFAGTSTMNVAFMDRFIVAKAEFMDAKTEAKLLNEFANEVFYKIYGKQDKTFMKRFTPYIEMMIKVANESRKSAMNNSGFDRPISLRGLKRWVVKSIQYKDAPNPIKVSVGEAITNGYPKSLRDSVIRFCSDIFGEDFSDLYT
ncbi:MAG: AAA family ATPase [Thalassotalea sp.]|nr:AAA family ATPase [Thalassotalea sp.]